MSDEKASLFNRLRRLQEHSRSLIPGLIAQRAMSSFNLQDTPETETGGEEVQVTVYPQDPFVGMPEVRIMQARDIRPGLFNARVRIVDNSAPLAVPDGNGNYLYWTGWPQFNQVNVLYYVTFTLRMFERYARRSLPWAFPQPRIMVQPHAGTGANAYYNEQERALGFFSFSANGQNFNAAESADIISHETAHAILDGMRDLYNESFGLYTSAFHESFGDMTAVLVALHDDTLARRLLDWTGGDLRLPNFIAGLAEHLARGVRASDHHVQEHTLYLRNAINVFKHLPFDSVPYQPADSEHELGRESHNYSRVFTGTFYELLACVYDELLKANEPPLLALHKARDVMGSLLTSAVELGPVGEFDFSDMARAFITADALNGGTYFNVIASTFAARGILDERAAQRHRNSLAALPDLRLDEAITTALDAGVFLEDVAASALALPDVLDFTPLAAYRSSDGRAYLTYYTHQKVALEGEQFRVFDGSHIDAFGGLTLMFDADGRLRSAFLRQVTDEDVRQIRIMIADMIAAGLIATGTARLTPSAMPMHVTDDPPRAVSVPDVSDADTPDDEAAPVKLVKSPVHVDEKRQVSPLLQYLNALKERL